MPAPAPLVGRAEELRRLDQRLDEVAAGQGRVALVTGEAGIGKTRLCREALARATARDFLVLEGRAHAVESALAYGPILEAFGRCLRAVPERRRGALIAGLPDLGRLFAELAPPPPPGGDAALEKARLFDAVARLVERLAAEAPLLLFLDDLQWADQASLELVHHLARRIESQRVLLLATRRSEGSDGELLGLFVRSLPRLGIAEELTLGRLDAPAVAALAGDVLGGKPPAPLLDALERRARGVPLFAETLVRALIEAGRLVRMGDAWALGPGEAELPAAARQVVVDRLARLAPGDRRILDAVAVQGGPLPHALLLAVIGDEAVVLAAVRRLVSAGLLVEEVDHARVAYSAGHPLLAEVAYAELPAALRRRLHLALATALEERGGDPDRLARHYLGAGADAEPQRTLTVLVAAGERARDASANEEAARHYAGALALVREGHQTERLPWLLDELGRAWQRVGKGAAAVSVWREALALAEAAADGPGQIRLHRQIAQEEFERGRLEQARAHLDAGRALVLAAPPAPGQAALYYARVELLERAADPEALAAAVQELEAFAAQVGAPRVRLEAALAASRWHHRQGRFGDAAASFAEATAAAEAAGDPWPLLRLHDAGCAVSMERGDLPALRRHTDAALALALRLGAPASELRSRGYRATADYLAGRWEAAEEGLIAVLALARRFDIPRGLARGHSIRAMVKLARGDLAGAAAEIVRAAEAVPAAGGDRHVASSLVLVEAWLALDTDDLAAVDRLHTTLTGPGELLPIRLLARAELALRAGQPKDVERWTEPLAGLDDTPYRRGLAARALGLAAAARSRRGPARAAFERAAEELAAAEMPYDAARAKINASAFMPRTAAVIALQQALAVLESLGAARLADRARKLLRTLGVRPPPVRRPGPGGGPLSRRELEVASLISQGLTTAEVAQRLVISPHTAATHLQRIYRRLGLSSRATLTRFLSEHGLL